MTRAGFGFERMRGCRSRRFGRGDCCGGRAPRFFIGPGPILAQRGRGWNARRSPGGNCSADETGGPSHSSRGPEPVRRVGPANCEGCGSGGRRRRRKTRRVGPRGAVGSTNGTPLRCPRSFPANERPGIYPGRDGTALRPMSLRRTRPPPTLGARGPDSRRAESTGTGRPRTSASLLLLVHTLHVHIERLTVRPRGTVHAPTARNAYAA